ncbi:VOC family protein [Streptomyces sp. NPDC096032]|uniref:VOC family protein n=1 Tax=Streptomyces sp. NPDC096032 TaxID=3366070 RepID=UPI003813F2A5
MLGPVRHRPDVGRTRLGQECLIVPDIDAARTALLAAGVEVDAVFHPRPDASVEGLDPEGRSYLSRAAFRDPDGNTWLLQEVTTRLPGGVEPGPASFTSRTDLASALRRAAAAHGEHEKRRHELSDTGRRPKHHLQLSAQG